MTSKFAEIHIPLLQILLELIWVQGNIEWGNTIFFSVQNTS